MRRLKILYWLLPVVILLPACAAEERESDNDGDEEKDSGTADAGKKDSGGDLDSDGGNNPLKGCQMMDILFVIDDSGSMQCEQDLLVQAFPGFIDVLEQYNNANTDQISYRVGVTSTGRTVKYTQNIPGFPSMDIETEGMDGALNTVAGLSDPWIDGPGNQTEISAAFTELATLGIMGPGYEMPLLGMKMALEKTEAGEVNEGFLRENALFIAVAITDEDDCSRLDDDFEIGIEKCANFPEKHNLIDLQVFKDELDERFGGPERYVFVAIAGQSDCGAGSYASACGDPELDGAESALRMQDFVNGFVGASAGGNGLFFDICSVSLPDALAAALDQMEVVCDDFTPVE